jgi:CRISPR-associated endonuclease/helicase Cas3
LKFYAHSTQNPDKSDWQPLNQHLHDVALLAERFASAFGAGAWGRSAGLLHDAGKATIRFVQRLEGSTQRVDHSTFGARIAEDQAGNLGVLLAYVIAGHHGGLPNGGEQETELHFRLKNSKLPDDLALLPELEINNDLVPPFKLDRERGGFSLAFFTRMIFSCLVDADFLDTENFCTPDQSEFRPQNQQSLQVLKQKLDKHLLKLSAQAQLTPVNRLRAKILSDCRRKADKKPQTFSLTVPTGGGKTLSSLAFALDHAVANRQCRVIYAIPFTSIIEQNAGVFQDVLGRESVLEHHCNYKESDNSDEVEYNRRRGLAAENWDAPLVVTTNVQFFESLFSNKPSRCRKLHNIANSVIVLDEAQAIPTEYLEPCLAALRELVEHYNCTVVLCTATQPAFDTSELRNRLPQITEIIDQPQQLYENLRRTKVEFVGKLSNEKLAGRLQQIEQVLCIVSTKPQACQLFEMLPEGIGNYHLSTNMYPEHRRRVLDEIRLRLKQGEPCRVISTSLVEAGVDLDFPVVYRAMAGLDSIAQAAGRCNREGRMNEAGELGQVYVYEPEPPVKIPWVKRCVSRAGEARRSLPEADPLGLELMRRYFELLYDVQELDKKKIYWLLNQLTPELYFPFREVAENFRFIEDETTGVIIPADAEVNALVRQLDFVESPRPLLRRLQAYTVAVRSREFAALESAGALEMVQGQFPVLRNLSAYKDDIGLCIDEGEVWSPEELIS